MGGTWIVSKFKEGGLGKKEGVDTPMHTKEVIRKLLVF